MAARRAAIGQRKRLEGLGKPAPDIRRRARRIGWLIRVAELYLTTGDLDTKESERDRLSATGFGL